MRRKVRISVVTAMLGWIAIVMSGCAANRQTEARTNVQEASPERGASYAQAARALAQEAKALVQEAPAGVGEMSAVAEATGCDIEEDGPYSDGLYSPEEPLASMIALVKTEEDCNNEQIACFSKCWNSKLPKHLDHIKKGSAQHHNYCTSKCRKEFHDCLKNAGLLQEFSVMDAALSWLKSHGKEVLGTVVLIGGVTYIVATGGGGALILAVL